MMVCDLSARVALAVLVLCGLSGCPNGGLRDGAERRHEPAGASAPRAAVCPMPASGWRERLDDAARVGVAGRAQLADSLAPSGTDCMHARLMTYDRYLDYLRRLQRLPAVGTLAERLGAIWRLREEVFAQDERAALFAEDEQYERYVLSREAVLADSSLGEGARRAALRGLDALLPADARRARQAAMAPADWLQAEAALRAGGATDAAVDAERRQRFGAVAAGRLAMLDAERAAWLARVVAYRRARRAVELMTPDSAGRTAALVRLRERSFSPQEILRLDAYVAAD